MDARSAHLIRTAINDGRRIARKEQGPVRTFFKLVRHMGTYTYSRAMVRAFVAASPEDNNA